MGFALRSWGVAAAFASLVAAAPAQAMVAYQTIHRSGQSVYDQAYDVATDAQRNVVTVGHTTDAFGNADVAILKYDRWGNLLWSQAFKGVGNGYDSGRAVAVDAAGNIFVAARVANAISDAGDIATLKVSPNGVLIWSAFYDGPVAQLDEPVSLVLDSQGNVIVGGNSDGGGSTTGGTSRDYVTLKYDAFGSLLWANRLNGPGNGFDTLRDIAVTGDGTVVATGSVQVDATQSNDIGTIAYHPDGSVKWSVRYGGPSRDEASGLAADAAGNVSIITSQRDPWNASDMVTIRYDADGNLLWEARYRAREAESPDIPYGVAVDDAGNTYVTGDSLADLAMGVECTTLKYGPDGTLQWINRFDGTNENRADGGRRIEVDRAGNVYVIGRSVTQISPTAFANDLLALRLAPAGTFVSARKLAAPAGRFDPPETLAVDSNGNIVTASTVRNGNYGNIATLSIAHVIARPDSYSLPEDGVVTTDTGAATLWANDFSTSGYLPPVELVTPTSHGRLSLTDGTGRFHYQPDPNFSGTDSFTYRLSEPFPRLPFQSDVVTVTFNVTPTPDAPIITNDFSKVAGNSPTTIAVLANDLDPDGDPLTLFAFTSASKGTVVKNANGTLTYTPNLWSGGEDTFTYTVDDGTGRRSQGGVAITVYAADVSSEVTTTLGAVRLNKKTGKYEQSVSLTNVGNRDLPNLRLLLGGLTGATLTNPSGTSTFWTPGSPFMTVPTGRTGVLSPRKSVTLTLTFSGASPAYAVKPLAGAGAP